MAATFAPLPSTAYTVPSLKYYFTPATFKEVGQSRSRPSSSSSNSSYGNTPSSSNSTSFTSPSSDFALSPSSALSPSQDSRRLSRLNRPLPTPPTTPLSCRASLPPRPLPCPPLHRAQSIQHLRRDPLPVPPASRSQTPPLAPIASTSALPTSPAEAGPSTPRKNASSASVARTPERPSIRLNIPTSQTPSLSLSAHLATATPIPLSPIAFNIPGPRDLRRRREEELERRMKALGFVESPRSPKENAVPDAAAEPSPSHDRKFSISSVETDEDREVVLLVDHESDMEDQEPEPEPERERPPTRSQSRAAMLTLFSDDSDDSDDRDTLGHPYRLASVDEREIETLASGLPGVGSRVDVDVEVEVVTKEAVARTKRRFSRKWIRERRGKRWTEQDFSEIIAQLRKLR